MISNISEIYASFVLTDQQICTDTRRKVKNSFFVCLKGENHDANLIAEEAMSAGARFVLTNRTDLAAKEGYLIVEDTLKALQNLANYHRRKLATRLIAIGGSNGKTTTKELLYSVMSGYFNVYATPGNFNNHIGVPLTLLQLRTSHDFGIIEMGINHPNEMTELCEIAEPNEGVLTNIGKEHLEGFGSIEGVAKAESELFDYLLKNEGLSYVNLDDIWIANMSKRLSRKVTYSALNQADICYRAQQVNPRIIFQYKGICVESVLSGDYNFSNIVSAVAIAEHHNVPPKLIAQGISNYIASNNRSEWKKTVTNLILVDCYNANPSSMELAIKNVLEMPNPRKVFFIGDMLEMGSFASREHEAILNLASDHMSKKNSFIFVGPEFFKFKEKYPFVFFKNTDDCTKELSGNLRIENSLVLLKASRGIKLEKLLTQL